jgi:drug/metabolite transporter (DMT)-like permease
VKYSYSLPHSSETNLALLNTLGGFLTLGLYGWWRGGRAAGREWGISFLPMAMMAGGDLGVLVAFQNGPASIVTPLSGAYPVITLIFAWIVLKERLSFLQGFFVLLVLLGIFLAPGA